MDSAWEQYKLEARKMLDWIAHSKRVSAGASQCPAARPVEHSENGVHALLDAFLVIKKLRHYFRRQISNKTVRFLVYYMNNIFV